MGWSFELYLEEAVNLSLIDDSMKGSLPRESGLRSRRELLQDEVIPVLVQTKLDKRIPVLSIEEVLVHSINDGINRTLTLHVSQTDGTERGDYSRYPRP